MSDTVSHVDERARHVDSSDEETDCPCDPMIQKSKTFDLSSDDGYISGKYRSKKKVTLKNGIKGIQKWNKMSSTETRKVITRPCRKVFKDVLAFVVSSLGTVSKIYFQNLFL